MGLLESMSRDLSKAQRISIGDVRINRLNDALYDQASEEMNKKTWTNGKCYWI